MGHCTAIDGDSDSTCYIGFLTTTIDIVSHCTVTQRQGSASCNLSLTTTAINIVGY